jgi:hypothetical protein
MADVWNVASTVIAAGGVGVAVASLWIPHRRCVKADQEATDRAAKAAQGRASLVTASVPWSSSTTLDVCITNGGPSAIGDVEVLDVRQAPSGGGVGWRLNPSIRPNTKGACILQPQETLTARVQLINPHDEPVRPVSDARLVIVFGFRDTEGQWWKREIGKPPQPWHARSVG